MKKLLPIILFLSFGGIALGQNPREDFTDLVVLADGDSLRCRIVTVGEDFIRIEKTGDEVAGGELIPLAGIASYSLYYYEHGSVSLPPAQELVYAPLDEPFLYDDSPPVKRNFMFRMYLEGGVSFRPNIVEYESDGMSGYQLGTLIQFLSPGYRHAVGVNADFMHQKYDLDKIIKADIFFIAPAYSLMIPNPMYRSDFFIDLAAGLTTYREKDYRDSYRTAAFGAKVSVGTCFIGFRGVGFHIRASYFFCHVPGDNSTGLVYNKNNSTFNISVGLTFGRM